MLAARKHEPNWSANTLSKREVNAGVSYVSRGSSRFGSVRFEVSRIARRVSFPSATYRISLLLLPSRFVIPRICKGLRLDSSSSLYDSSLTSVSISHPRNSHDEFLYERRVTDWASRNERIRNYFKQNARGVVGSFVRYLRSSCTRSRFHFSRFPSVSPNWRTMKTFVNILNAFSTFESSWGKEELWKQDTWLK